MSRARLNGDYRLVLMLIMESSLTYGLELRLYLHDRLREKKDTAIDIAVLATLDINMFSLLSVSRYPDREPSLQNSHVTARRGRSRQDLLRARLRCHLGRAHLDTFAFRQFWINTYADTDMEQP